MPREFIVTLTVIEDANYPYKEDGIEAVKEDIRSCIIASNISMLFRNLTVNPAPVASHHPGTEKTGHPVTECEERKCNVLTKAKLAAMTVGEIAELDWEDIKQALNQ